MTDDLERRVGDLELAVLALAVEEFGDLPGHPFRGNQYSGGGGSSQDQARVENRGQHVYEGEPQPSAGRAMDLLREIDAQPRDARNMDRAQKLLNYEKMHGTEAMLKQMTPAEREAHAATPIGEQFYTAAPGEIPAKYETSLFPGQKIPRDTGTDRLAGTPSGELIQANRENPVDPEAANAERRAQLDLRSPNWVGGRPD